MRLKRLTHKTGLPYLSMTTDLKGRCVRRACLLIVERIPCSCSAKLLLEKGQQLPQGVDYQTYNPTSWPSGECIAYLFACSNFTTRD